MNVLSLFDGLSCGQIALNKVGIKYDKYFASEIGKGEGLMVKIKYDKILRQKLINMQYK